MASLIAKAEVKTMSIHFSGGQLKTLRASGIAIFCLCLLVRVKAVATGEQFRPGNVWLDTAGRPIDAHLGGVLLENGVYYWYGMDFDSPTFPPLTIPRQSFSWVFNKGVSIYSSVDLFHWTRVGTALSDVSYAPGDLLQPLNLLARPKVIKNDSTGKFIMMAQLVSPDFIMVNDVVVAVADSPAGPFHLLGKLGWKGTPNQTGIWEHAANNLLSPKGDSSTRIRGFDIGLFKDDDGKGYLITAHNDVYMYELSDDYLSVNTVAKMEGASGEAPALFKWQGTYFFLASHLTGFAPNENYYATALSIHGPWMPRGPFARGPKEKTTFDTQVTFVLPVAGKRSAFIFMADRFNASSTQAVSELGDATYVWLPIEMSRQSMSMKVEWKDHWDLSSFSAN
jgi:beta-xylosidase